MLSVIGLTLLIVASVLACNPDGDNKPECDSSNLYKPIRNFLDPIHYWMCLSAGDEPEMIRCPDSKGFDDTKSECVAFSEWKWTEPCPEEINSN